MATLTTPSILTNTQTHGYDATWASLMSAMDKPQVWKELIQLYGPLMGMFEALHLSGAEVDVANHSETYFTEGSYERTVTIDTQAAVAAAGALFTFNLSASDYDTTTGRPYLQVGNTIYIPAEYCELNGVACTLPLAYHVISVGATAADNCTARPVDILGEVAVAVPANTTFMVSGGGYAPGTAGATPRNSGWYSATFKTAIKKSAAALIGGIQSTERYYEKLVGGGTGMFNKASIEADFDLNSQMNVEILIGEEYTNTNITQTDRDSVATSGIYGTKGIMRHLDEDGMRLVYAGLPTITDCDQIKIALLSQGVTDTRANGYFGPNLYRYMENAGADWLKEYSSGTDLMKSYGEIGIEIKAIRKNGIVLALNEMKSFANPMKFGVSSYDFSDTGIILPETSVQTSMNANGEGAKKMKNLVIGYKSYNGENRRRIVNYLPGVNGLVQFGNQANDTYDDFRIQMLSEFMVMFFKANQGILMQKA